MEMKKILKDVKVVKISCDRGLIARYKRIGKNFYIFDVLITYREIENVFKLFEGNKEVKITFIK